MEDEKSDKVNEPTIGYGSKRLMFFSSFDEEQEWQYNYWRSLTPEQRLEEHRILSKYAFSEYEKYTGHRLIFD